MWTIKQALRRYNIYTSQCAGRPWRCNAVPLKWLLQLSAEGRPPLHNTDVMPLCLHTKFCLKMGPCTQYKKWISSSREKSISMTQSIRCVLLWMFGRKETDHLQCWMCRKVTRTNNITTVKWTLTYSTRDLFLKFQSKKPKRIQTNVFFLEKTKQKAKIPSNSTNPPLQFWNIQRNTKSHNGLKKRETKQI